MAVRFLGKKTVAAAGAPETIAALLSNNAAGTPQHAIVKAVQLQALPGNTGIVYVGSAAMVRASGVGIGAALAKAASATTGPFASQSFGDPTGPPKLNLKDIYIDVDTNGDGVYVTIVDDQS